MLHDLAVGNPEHVKPRRRVALARVLGVRILAPKGQDDQVTFRHDGNQRRLNVRGDGLGLLDLGEKLHERSPPAGHIGVVLDVLVRQVFGCQIHVAAFKHLPPEIKHQALVRRQLRIAAGQ